MVNCTERRIVFGLNYGRAATGPQEARQNLLYQAIGSNLAYTFSNLEDNDIHVETSSESNRTCRSSLVRLSGTRAKLLPEAMDTEVLCRSFTNDAASELLRATI